MDTRNQIKQYLDIAWRRRWLVLIPTVVGIIVATFLALTAPKIYRASTTILVLRQSVPEDIVRTTVTMRVDERMKSLRIQVMSLRYLEQVIKEFGLAPANADGATIERACRRLEDNVELDWDKRDLSWFNIMVMDEQPERAANVANRLADLFIEQNTEMREAQAKGTVETVGTWLDTTEAELRKRDAEIANFKAQHLYELPDQETATLQLLQSAQARVQQLTSDIAMRSERLAILRVEEQNRRATADALGVNAATDDPDVRALAQLNRDLQDLLSNYTEENPLVKRKRAQIAQFKSLHPELDAPRAAPGAGEPATSPEVARVLAEIRGLEADRTREQQNADVLRGRIANMPLRLQQLNALTRDYDSLKQRYDTTYAQKDLAKRAQDIEANRKGEQFLVQDRARPPAVPYKPNLIQFLFMGAFGGLALGAAVSAALEFLDQAVRSEDEFASRFPDMPILGSIPSLDADSPSSRGVFGRRTKGAAVFLLAAALIDAVLKHGGPFA